MYRAYMRFLVYNLHIYFGEITNKVSTNHISSRHIFAVNCSILHWLNIFSCSWWFSKFLIRHQISQKCYIYNGGAFIFYPVIRIIDADTIKACVRYFLSNFYFSPNGNPSKTIKNVFYFI